MTEEDIAARRAENEMFKDKFAKVGLEDASLLGVNLFGFGLGANYWSCLRCGSIVNNRMLHWTAMKHGGRKG
jgi:hypothetical protein